MPSLTRHEAAERASTITVRTTSVELDLTTGSETEFHSVTRLSFDASGDRTFIDIKPATLHSVTLNGVALDLAGFADERMTLTGLQPSNELVVVADMLYSHDGEGLHRYVDPADGNVYLYGHTFLDAAPRVFACFDQPDLKSTYTFTVKAPEDWLVLGNAPAAKGADGLWRTEETKPLSTYFAVVMAGPYHAVYSEHDGIPLGLFARQSLAEYLDADAAELFEVTSQCLDEYKRLFGMKYPFGKYDQVFCPEFNAGAMENPGVVTFRDQFIYRSAVTDAERGLRAMVVAHEMAHMWFGDLVTMRWWDDLWLNESFADYMGHRVTADATRFSEAWTAFAVENKPRGYAADQRASTHPISADVPDAMAGLLNFDGISYAKGASVLRQLVARIGDEALLAGLREYFARYSYGNAELKDFLEVLGNAAGTDLSGWAQKWLREANVNTLYPEITVADGRIATAAIRQTAEPTHPTLRPHTLNVGLYGAGGQETVRVDIDGELTSLPELVGKPAPEFLLLNDGDLAFAKIRFDEASLAVLPDFLPGLDSLNRAMVWNALLQAVRDGELPGTSYVDVAVRTLGSETQIATLTEVLKSIKWFIIDTYVAPAEHAAALARVASSYREFLAAAEPGSGRALALFRALIESTADVAELRGWLAGENVPAGLSMDIERAWQVRYRLAILGSLTAGELAEASAADQSAQGQEYTALCSAATPAAEAKAKAWESIMTDGQLSNYAVWNLARGFWQPEQRELTRPYVERYFTELPATGKLRSFQVTETLAVYLYPRYELDRETLRHTATLLSRDDIEPSVRRAVVDRTDDLRRSIEALKL
ncbi:aminopeptidase N [Longispora albida]|uniref:aminopeptidase N n=1 Tax=Longispora albida TaxID=203523 RepID=UPI00037A69AE|nr:aminopeptidase N [Longispora albida]